ncbi:3-phenylpropionate/trans-cinnamate dioxygenase ferredoxin subunit [Leucobacter exalbidus]|uniref:3-phenylpropionate/trans-cinnamate dioxygenase ferredoxin subunit n=1 Tax=Leucobacter exalbidus TaxID=662960 RepID=A0A940PS49_9MICO|nr:non-heme iron oxygenase ferredoxin subunit [Leucobacter exalbidus]MBP1325235.1 3-phenylpropionate/trans-cinnamate dioxygenase ferredoxin subunit [Leucobacter exalbidus]
MAREKVIALSELVQDQATRAVVGDVPIAIVLDGQGQVHAIGDTCTHGQISLSEGFVEGETLECWAHGSQFSLTTGVPQNLPAYEPVPVYVVEIEDGDVYIDTTITKEI